MTSGYGTASGTFALDPRATEGVLGRRLMGYFVDLVIIAILMGILWIGIAVLGVVTFGFGWTLFALLPLTGIIYNAITIGGPAQATIGMRAVGVRVIDALDGGRVPMLTAAVHALLFYVALTTFVLWAVDVLLGMLRNDRRLGHDLLAGVALIRSA
jgi:uncharacterized RDD family membrane protein YckC